MEVTGMDFELDSMGWNEKAIDDYTLN
jgi:hypothetical protein